ncbi:MAG: hypothetical protein CMJ45_07925 [Planctomyces sp.]|nr:hypothetical protein [Planctomyces sp.]
MPIFRIVLPVLLFFGLVFLACQGETGQDPAATQGKDPNNNPATISSGTSIPAPSVAPSSTASPTNSGVRRDKSQAAGPVSATTQRPLPTPNPNNTPWVKERLDAVVGLYGLSEEGAALVGSLDLRQTRGDPGFFGSYGFNSWAGVGEAKPIGVMHELGHSYWGGFPIEGSPELSWERPSSQELSPALQSYHADVLAFMAQPPDGFEILRQRLRNLPKLSSANPEPLIHNLEADMVYNTGGDLALVPPILRRYWSRFLMPGSFGSWENAVGWFRGLSRDDRSMAGKFLGFEHLDLRSYNVTGGPDLDSVSLEDYREILVREEKQRLFDLADQFDLLIGDAQKEENFGFWRGYLRDKVDLHRRHPDYMASLELERAATLAEALEFTVDLVRRSPVDQASRLRRELSNQPILINFLPALENETLLLLFADSAPLPEGPTLQATASFVDRLNRFGRVVDQVIEAGRRNRLQGAAELVGFLEGTGYAPEEDIKLFFELFGDSHRGTATGILRILDKDSFRRSIEVAPFHLRSLLTADELLPKLNIVPSAGLDELALGIAILVEEPSGNFIVDEPYLLAMYRVVADRTLENPGEMAGILGQESFSMEGFIMAQPAAAVTAMRSDMEAALTIVGHSDAVISPPARIMYRLIHADPDLASDMMVALDEQGDTGLMVESLAYFAYDDERSKLLSGLADALGQDGKLLQALLKEQGAEWLTQRLGEAFSLHGGDGPEDFRSRYRSTLDAAVATLEDADEQEELRRVIETAAGNKSGR